LIRIYPCPHGHPPVLLSHKQPAPMSASELAAIGSRFGRPINTSNTKDDKVDK
jgi:hypothetical protein